MNAFGTALALVDALTQEGAGLELDGDGLALVGAPSEALCGRLVVFCGAHEGREGLDTYRALRAVVRARSRAARELLVLPVSYAVGLPYPFTILFVRRACECVCTTSRTAYALALSRGRPTFLVRELEAAALAAEQGRAGARDLDRWLELKARGEWRLTPELAGVLEAPGPRVAMLCFGALFDVLGAELVDVELLEVEPRRGAA